MRYREDSSFRENVHHLGCEGDDLLLMSLFTSVARHQLLYAHMHCTVRILYSYMKCREVNSDYLVRKCFAAATALQNTTTVTETRLMLTYTGGPSFCQKIIISAVLSPTACSA